MDYKPTPFQLQEFIELQRSLNEDHILISYHGTTREQAELILKEGFRPPNLFKILMEAYHITGLTREVRRSLPRWALEYIANSEVVPRLFQSYHQISFAPHGVASRWAGWRGEVLHETVRNINLIKAFMASNNYPKDEDGYDEWIETVNIRDFYQNLGEPVVLRAWIQLDPQRADRIARELHHLVRDLGLEDAWTSWNFAYRDDRVSDPSRILKIEIAEPPFTGYTR